jgi:chromosome segregation protein
LAAQIPSAEEELTRQQQELRAAETALMASERTLAERQSRLEILQQLNAEGAGLTEGSQAVLRGLDDPERILPEVMGALASLIEVDQDFIPTIEAALGRNLHAIVLRNDALANEIVVALTTRKLGQTALITPELTRSAEVVAQELPPGALGWATDKVRAPAELEPLVRHLLGDVALVPNLTEALKLRKKFTRLTFATPAGDFVSAKGVIHGGSVNQETSSLFARKAQMTALAAEHGALLEKRDDLDKSRDEIQVRVEAAIEHLETSSRAAPGRARRSFRNHFASDGRSSASCTKRIEKWTRCSGKERPSLNKWTAPPSDSRSWKVTPAGPAVISCRRERASEGP